MEFIKECMWVSFQVFVGGIAWTLCFYLFAFILSLFTSK